MANKSRKRQRQKNRQAKKSKAGTNKRVKFVPVAKSKEEPDVIDGPEPLDEKTGVNLPHDIDPPQEVAEVEVESDGENEYIAGLFDEDCDFEESEVDPEDDEEYLEDFFKPAEMQEDEIEFIGKIEPKKKDDAHANEMAVAGALSRVGKELRADLWLKIGRSIGLPVDKMSNKLTPDDIPIEGQLYAALMRSVRAGDVELRHRQNKKGFKSYEVVYNPPKWTRFTKAEVPEETKAKMVAGKRARVFVNSRYQVNVRPVNTPRDKVTGQRVHPPFYHLSIKRHDKAPVRSYRDLQRIKNELIGVEAEGVELYPRESRMVDTSNQYHMYVLQEPHQFPFGSFGKRVVSEQPPGGSLQEPWEEDNKPEDLTVAVTVKPNERVRRKKKSKIKKPAKKKEQPIVNPEPVQEVAEEPEPAKKVQEQPKPAKVEPKKDDPRKTKVRTFGE